MLKLPTVLLASGGVLASAVHAQSTEVEGAPPQMEIQPEVVEGPVFESDYRKGKRDPEPKRSPQSWITIADYPVEAWKTGKIGEVGYSLKVDVDGKVTDCSIVSSSGHVSLDEKTCALVSERAEFSSALNQAEEPVAGEYYSYFDWKKLEPEFRTGFIVKVQYVLDETGEQSACSILEVSETIPESLRRSLEREPCPTGDVRPGIPYRDDDGNPVARAVTVQYRVDVAPVAE